MNFKEVFRSKALYFLSFCTMSLFFLSHSHLLTLLKSRPILVARSTTSCRTHLPRCWFLVKKVCISAICFGVFNRNLKPLRETGVLCCPSTAFTSFCSCSSNLLSFNDNGFLGYLTAFCDWFCLRNFARFGATLLSSHGPSGGVS